MKLVFTLNGKSCEVETNPSKRLLDILRDDLGITSVKEGCGEGECGACTVILNGDAVNSCLIAAGQVRGQCVVTVEGLKNNGELSRLQKAFIDCGAIQCGYCTPGMLLSAKALLDKTPDPTEEQIRLALAGNLCRCTGYGSIINAVKQAAEMEE